MLPNTDINMTPICFMNHEWTWYSITERSKISADANDYNASASSRCTASQNFQHAEKGQKKQFLNKVIWEELRLHPSWHKMDSPAAYDSCEMPTADKSSYSAAGMLHPHHTDRHMTMEYTVPAQRVTKKYGQIKLVLAVEATLSLS